MKADEATIEGAVRISVGCTTTVSEIDDTIERFIRIFARLSGKQFAG